MLPKETAPVHHEVEEDAAQAWFIDQFGVPFSWAVQMSKLDSDVGKRWKTILETLNNPDVPDIDA